MSPFLLGQKNTLFYKSSDLESLKASHNSLYCAFRSVAFASYRLPVPFNHHAKVPLLVGLKASKLKPCDNSQFV